jgi:hypothetical protein
MHFIITSKIYECAEGKRCNFLLLLLVILVVSTHFLNDKLNWDKYKTISKPNLIICEECNLVTKWTLSYVNYVCLWLSLFMYVCACVITVVCYVLQIILDLTDILFILRSVRYISTHKVEQKGGFLKKVVIVNICTDLSETHVSCVEHA